MDEESGGRISERTLARGLYSTPGFRHKGWITVEVEDRETPEDICDACQSQKIRFVHILEHADKSSSNNNGRLEAGCVCAGFLTDDYVGSETWESRVRKESARKARAATREAERAASAIAAAEWRRQNEARKRELFKDGWVRDASKPTTTRHGRTFTVFRSSAGYGLRRWPQGFVKAKFQSEEEAQAHALAIEFGEVVPDYEPKS